MNTATRKPRQLYCVVEAQDSHYLAEEVQRQLDQGWQLSAGVVVSIIDHGGRLIETWAQALTKLADEEPSR